MTQLKNQIPDELKILIVFGYGNIFEPSTGNESRINHLIRGIANQNEIITLERMEFQKYICGTKIVKKRYFFNSLNIQNTHFGVIFLDFNPLYFLKINEIIKKENPNIIQISYPRGLIAAKLCKWLNRKKDIVLVYESHDVQIEVSKIIANDSSIPYIKRYAIYLYDKIIEKVAVEVADHIISVSNVDKKKFIEKYSLNPEKITVIPSATSVPIIERIGTKIECKEKLGLDANKITIIFHGYYDYLPNKAAITVIEEFIAPKIGNLYKGVTFVIAGKDAPKTKKNNIIYLGFVEDLHKLIRAADLAIVPILKGGGTRIKILDYMCMGLPIVTTKKGIEGIEAKNGEDAIIVDNVDEKFINAIKYLIENKDECERLGRNARKLAEERYDWEKIGEKLNALYERLVKNGKRER